jgi:hypothetical protein
MRLRADFTRFAITGATADHSDRRSVAAILAPRKYATTDACGVGAGIGSLMTMVPRTRGDDAEGNVYIATGDFGHGVTRGAIANILPTETRTRSVRGRLLDWLVPFLITV